MLALDALRSELTVTARDILGLAWLLEQAARGCDLDGKDGWARDLRHDASRLRAMAVDR